VAAAGLRRGASGLERGSPLCAGSWACADALQLCVALLHGGKRPSSARSRASARRASPARRSHVAGAALCAQKGETDRAEAYLKNALICAPTHPDANHMVRSCSPRVAVTEQGPASAVVAAVAHDPALELKLWTLQYARILSEHHGNHEDAELIYKQTLDRHPKHVDTCVFERPL
jgi:hypothetical protein